MSGQAAILEFDRVTIEADAASESGVWDASLRLEPGGFLLIRQDPWRPIVPVADLAMGLLEPASGRVEFEGRTWASRPWREACAARGRIGRAFVDDAFLSNLDVDENILLGQRHHSARGRGELAAEAGELSRVFGLPGLPRGRAWTMRRQDLRRAALVRAFMGQPALLLLEEPMRELSTDVLPALLNLCRRVRSRGGGVVWLTADRRVWSEPAMRASQRMEMRGARMLPA